MLCTGAAVRSTRTASPWPRTPSTFLGRRTSWPTATSMGRSTRVCGQRRVPPCRPSAPTPRRASALAVANVAGGGWLSAACPRLANHTSQASGWLLLAVATLRPKSRPSPCSSHPCRPVQTMVVTHNSLAVVHYVELPAVDGDVQQPIRAIGMSSRRHGNQRMKASQ